MKVQKRFFSLRTALAHSAHLTLRRTIGLARQEDITSISAVVRCSGSESSQKTAKLDIRKICPLHGPVLDENLGWYIGLYDIWSKYEPETDGVFIAYCSVHGNTAKAAEKLCEIIKSKTDKKVSIADLSRTDLAEDIEDAFRFSRMVVIAPSYDGGVFPIMNDFLHHLKIKGYKNRKVAMVENGSWAPSAAKTMRTYLEEMKNVEICPTVVTIRSAMKEENIPQLEQLSDEILG